MTVTQSFSLSLTYTSLRMYLPQTVPAPTPASSDDRTPAPTRDTVTLSPEAAATGPAQEESVSTPPGETPKAPEASPEVPSAPTSRAAERAGVLLDALDADHDGAITKDEFVDGAMELLRRAGARHQHHRVHGEGHDHRDDERHGMHRLERRLDGLFDRVDASGDDNVDQEELTEALRKVTRDRQPDTSETPVPTSGAEPQQPLPAAAVSYTSVSVVIAVQQYTSVAAMQV